jgi:hypothetical protein
MIDIIESLWPGLDTDIAVALDVAIKATLLLSLAYVAHAALGRRRVLARSAVWCALLIGLVLVPLAALALPQLTVAMLPAVRPTADVTTLPARTAPTVGVDTLSNESSQNALSAPITEPTVEHVGATKAVEPAVAHQDSSHPLNGAAIGILIYLAVASLLAIRLGFSLAATRRLVALSLPVDEPAWALALERASGWESGDRSRSSSRRMWLFP